MKKDRNRVRFFVSSVIAAIIVLGISYSIYGEFFAKKEMTAAVLNDNIAPNFTLEDLDGNIVKLEDYRGKGVLLNFWATYCPPCEKEMPYLENAYQDYKDKNVVILAVDAAEPKRIVSQFVSEKHLNFPILLDRSGEVVDLYNIQNIPITLLINDKGEITEKISGELTEKKIRNYLDRIIPK